MIVGFYDVFETFAARDTKSEGILELELIAAFYNLIGTTLHAIGSIFFLNVVEMQIRGGCMFTIGSIFLIIGSSANLIHVYTFF